MKDLAAARPLTTDDVKEIREEDSAAHIGKLLTYNFIEKVEQKEHGELIEDRDMFSVILRTHKPQIMLITFFYVLDSIFRLTFSVFLYNLFL